MNFYKFLKNEEADFKKRYLKDIWKYSHEEIEKYHDFIQLIFPTNKQSMSVFHKYYLNDVKQIEQIKNDKDIRENILYSTNWFINFLENKNHWKSGYNHNQLRITRIIECLRLLVSDEEAHAFYTKIASLIDDRNKINKMTYKYWEDALRTS